MLQTQWGINDAELGNQGNLNTCGGGISTLAVEIIADNWGHRPTFILCLALVLAFGVGSAWATTFDAFSALRFGALQDPETLRAEYARIRINIPGNSCDPDLVKPRR